MKDRPVDVFAVSITTHDYAFIIDFDVELCRYIFCLFGEAIESVTRAGDSL